MHWTEEIQSLIVEACGHYERSAPIVHAWLDGLYIRMSDAPATVLLVELLLVERLREDGLWMQPNNAANQVFHLLDRLGRDTTGQAGF
jgi:hypothetical protein